MRTTVTVNNCDKIDIDYRTGVEGPKDDPYAWSECTAYVNGKTVVLRQSALGGAQLTINGKVVGDACFGEWAACRQLEYRFESHCGINPGDFEDRINAARGWDSDFVDPMGSPSDYI